MHQAQRAQLPSAARETYKPRDIRHPISKDSPMVDLAAARLNMVESQVRTADVTDVRLHDAMRTLPREVLLPPAKAYLAYADIEVEYAPGRSLLKPRDVAKLLQALRPMPGERACAVAAPYAAAVLERLGLSVVRADGDDLAQPPAGAPFDLIVCEGAVGRAPPAWLAALALKGRLGVVERDGPVGKACVYVCAEDGVGRREVFDATPPVLPGLAVQHGFAFD
jgi:protein-L-isoaspartate(D-aspartate) O-methyltransferase